MPLVRMNLDIHSTGVSCFASASCDVAYSLAFLLDTIEEAIVICQTCRHGGHAAHVLEWFMGEGSQRSRGVCPVADCDCRCADE
jgi:hypothetical protein